MDLAYIPSLPRSMIELGPIPLRGYAFCIILGVFVAIWLGNRRWIARGGRKGTVADIAVWAVPFGLVGGRLYHVVTSYELYFGEGRDPVDAFKIWEGGLGIWGAIAFGALGAWIACRRRGIPLPAWADALAPGIALAQAVGRWGNWFNQELYGRPTDLPWAVRIAEDHRPPESLGVATYHPTFLYESLWCAGVALLVIWADRKYRLGHGRAFALYVAAYTVGRFWIEYMRIDDAHHLLGLRLNNWTSVVVFLAAVACFVISAKKRPGREDVVEPGPGADDGPDGAGADGDDGTPGARDGGAPDGGKRPGGKPGGKDTPRDGGAAGAASGARLAKNGSDGVPGGVSGDARTDAGDATAEPEASRPGKGS